MTITTVSSRTFNQRPSQVKEAANGGPVIITDHGKPSHVLLSIEEYRNLTESNKTIVDMIAMDEDIDFSPPRLSDSLIKPADLS
ncbi:Antitoxin [Sulfidibacter corallicola]|uniref:Antitoxin n=1 Tax=Sulfidibacter corallicola TaxID=2818388 RepID=A0A8A4TRC1_SULCO|nr:type II toxin-antitoxin system Phd/YefM family antitoxin [Sulfidibacter corallicola]QTD52100.1 type II toxin-antitoxin system Phd/YefM family antitoxin [Sulfidibacter corallicola]